MCEPYNILSIYQNCRIIPRCGVLCGNYAERKLLDRVRDGARLRHLSLRTEEAWFHRSYRARQETRALPVVPVMNR